MDKKLSIIEALKIATESIKAWTINKLENKVDKDGNKVLSTNDYINEDKDKVTSIGDLSLLETTEKTNLVAAINEARTTGGATDEQVENAVNEYLDANPVVVSQPDWDQNDENAPDYIKNKPDIVTKEYVDEAISNVSVDVDEVYIQADEPIDAPSGSFWVDIDEEYDSSSVQVQSDWNVSDESAPDYIKNKPNVVTKEYVDEVISNVSVEVDTTLSHEGKAADAKAVGDALSEKQPVGNYVKTVNGNTPDENGNIEVIGGSGSVANAITYTPQTLTEEQKTQARENIGVSLIPFQAEKVYYEWNEDTEYDFEAIEMSDVSFERLIKIDDNAPDSTFFIGKTIILNYQIDGTDEIILEEEHFPGNDEYYMLGDCGFVVIGESIDIGANQPLTKGIWICDNFKDTASNKPLWWKIIDPAVPIDESVIPDTIARTTDIESLREQINASTSSTNCIVATDDGDGNITLKCTSISSINEVLF